MMQIKLYEERKKLGLSQEEVAKSLGITRAAYGQKERGQSPFLIDEMFALSEVFNKSLEDIFLPRSNQNGYKEKQGI